MPGIDVPKDPLQREIEKHRDPETGQLPPEWDPISKWIRERGSEPGGPPPSVLGKSFQAGESTIDKDKLTLNPEIGMQNVLGRGMALQSLGNTQQARQEAIGNRDTFVSRQTEGLRSTVGAEKERLTERIGKTGVTGEFAEQSKQQLQQRATQKIAQGEKLAFDDLMAMEGQFDAMEGGAIELLNNIDLAQFQQGVTERGMSAQLFQQLTDIDLTNQGIREGRVREGQEAAGSIVGLIAAIISSSRTFKRDNKELDKQEVLSKMMELEVENWKYNWDESNHIGCYAEDFNKTFGTGKEKEIQTVDVVGVLMASIQAQQEQIEELRGQINGTL